MNIGNTWLQRKLINVMMFRFSLNTWGNVKCTIKLFTWHFTWNLPCPWTFIEFITINELFHAQIGAWQSSEGTQMLQSSRLVDYFINYF